MKKLFDFIKNLFAKADEIEQKVEQFVAKSDFISPTIKKDVQSTLNKVNELDKWKSLMLNKSLSKISNQNKYTDIDDYR